MLMIAGAALLGWLLVFMPGDSPASGMPLDEFVARGFRLAHRLFHAVAALMRP
ncbi:MAG: hypothetical protein ACNS61_05275 [Candidatus Wenzhouxiangella sp. M2_3B_020]